MVFLINLYKKETKTKKQATRIKVAEWLLKVYQVFY